MYSQIDNLDLLIEEQRGIRQKINTVLKRLKEWFVSKINDVGELFKNIKDGFLSSIRGLKDHKGKVAKDVTVNGDTIIKKGTPIKTVTNDIKSDLNKLQITTKVVINDCKDGINFVEDNDSDNAIKTKNKVTDKIKKLALIVTPVMAGIFAITLYKKNEDDKKEFDSRLSKMESDLKDKSNKSNVDNTDDIIDTDNIETEIVKSKGKESQIGNIRRTMKTAYKILDKLDKSGMI